jgi:benzoyl-CoA reductase/2-hydroxyglutaryl-CoA dehydratase subunit BcrC/BadD/HgdB
MVIYYLSPWVPREWIQAHGHTPRGLWSSLERLAQGQAAGVCGFAQSALDWLRQDAETAAVIPTSCDQLRRSFDSLGQAEGRPRFLFNLPVTWQSRVGLQMYQHELERLGRFLVEIGGHLPSQEELGAAVASQDRRRNQLRRWCQGGSLRARELAAAFAGFHWDGSLPKSLTATGEQRTSKVPLALLGGPLPRNHWSVLDAIEETGGQVAIYGLEPGEASLLPPFPSPAEGQQPGAWLATHYFDHLVDVFQRPNRRFYDWLQGRLMHAQARGILLWHFYACDLWRAEAQTLRERTGLPVLLLEAAEPGSHAEAREIGRVQAFMEMLR